VRLRVAGLQYLRGETAVVAQVRARALFRALLLRGAGARADAEEDRREDPDASWPTSSGAAHLVFLDG
jgi:hypothetical protein